MEMLVRGDICRETGLESRSHRLPPVQWVCKSLQDLLSCSLPRAARDVCLHTCVGAVLDHSVQDSLQDFTDQQVCAALCLEAR